MSLFLSNPYYLGVYTNGFISGFQSLYNFYAAAFDIKILCQDFNHRLIGFVIYRRGCNINLPAIFLFNNKIFPSTRLNAYIDFHVIGLFQNKNVEEANINTFSSLEKDIVLTSTMFLMKKRLIR